MEQAIILCATQRSGSTLVCEDLRNNRLGLPEEYFIQFIDKDEVDVEKMINSVRTRGTDEDGFFSVKIMSNYAGKVDRHMRGGEAPADAPLWSALAEHYKGAVWVYLHRPSVVRQAISQVKSRKTGINHALSRADASITPGRTVVGYDGSDKTPVSITNAEIAEACVEILKENEMWEIFFQENGIEPIRLDYDTVAKDVSYLNQICAAAGVERPNLNSDRALMKLSNGASDQVFRNFVLAPEAPAAQRQPAPPAKPVDADPARSADKPADTFKPNVEETISVARGRWVNTPYYGAAEAMNRKQWDEMIVPFLGTGVIDFTHTLELAVGHGRMATILLEKATTYVGLDILHENIDVCRKRFGETENRRFVVNDGVELTGVEDDSITFGFCFDSMVHFDMDVIRSYLREFRRVLVPGGHVFLHHSNFSKNPVGDFQKVPHARNFMTVELFQLLAKKEGLKTVKSTKIDWGAGDRKMVEHDGLELLVKE